MGNKYLSNPQTRVRVRYARRLLRLERRVAALTARLDMERELRLHEIQKANFSGVSKEPDRAVIDAYDKWSGIALSALAQAQKSLDQIQKANFSVSCCGHELTPTELVTAVLSVCKFEVVVETPPKPARRLVSDVFMMWCIGAATVIGIGWLLFWSLSHVG